MSKTVLTVKGSWSAVYQQIYWQIDPRIEVVEVNTLAEASRTGDAVLLQGGGDINPLFYRQTNRHAVNVSQRRDYLEINLLQNAMRRRLPILGICRGHQMLNVFFGGSLHQDLMAEDVVIEDHGLSHSIEIYSPQLERSIPTDWVNSYHHQAVNKVGKGMKIAAVSLDGVVESTYMPGILGVQWHPEALWYMDPDWTELFYWHISGLRSKQKKLFFPSSPSERIEASSRTFRIDLKRSKGDQPNGSDSSSSGDWKFCSGNSLGNSSSSVETVPTTSG